MFIYHSCMRIQGWQLYENKACINEEENQLKYILLLVFLRRTLNANKKNILLMKYKSLSFVSTSSVQ